MGVASWHRLTVRARPLADLYRRGAQTLLASWEEYARAATGAAVHRCPGVAIAVFTQYPERAVYNNALLERELAAAERADALDAMEVTYAAAGVRSFAAWVHESDEAMREDLEWRGYTLHESTRAMGMTLEHTRFPRPEVELAPPDWFEYLRILGVPPTLLSGSDRAAFHLLIARSGGENVAAANGVRSRQRLRDLQRHNGGACPAPRTGYRADGPPRPRGARTRLPDGEPSSDEDG